LLIRGSSRTRTGCLLLDLRYVIASFFVWAVFIARKAMIIVAAVFAPIPFAGAAARATSAWVRRWVEFTVAMVFSKLVIVVIFALALSLVGSPGSGMAAVGTLFSGLSAGTSLARTIMLLQVATLPAS
jgi:hypothetical protein